MASTTTLTADTREEGFLVKRYTITSHTDGTVSNTAVSLGGLLMSLTTNPSNSPTDDWDLTLLCVDGVDVLGGQGANRDTTNSEVVTFNPPIPLAGNYTITGAGMGSGKTADVVFRIAPLRR